MRPPSASPVVTVHDPAGAPQVDVLDSSGDGPGRRRVVVAVLLVAVVGLVAGGLELRDRRAAAAEERRLRSAAELALVDGRSASVSATSRGYLLAVELEVRNDGPRPVQVAGGSWAGLALVRPVRLPSGSVRRVRLGLEVGCGGLRPAPLTVGDDLELQVRTVSTVRTVRLPVREPPLDPAAAQRLCGFLPVHERLLLLRQEQSLEDDALLLEGELSVAGRAPVELLSADAGPGLSAVLRRGTDGTAVRLPVTLPAAGSGTSTAVTYQVAVTVTDCGAVRGATGTAGLTVRTGDRQQTTAEALLPYEPALHAELLADRCPR